MSTEVTLSDLGIADIVDFMGIDSAPSERVSLARLKMSQTSIEKEIIIDGDALRKPVIKAGSYKLTIDKNTPDVFSETVTLRPFAFRWQYTVWDNDNRVSQKTVLSTKVWLLSTILLMLRVMHFQRKTTRTFLRSSI